MSILTRSHSQLTHLNCYWHYPPLCSRSIESAGSKLLAGDHKGHLKMVQLSHYDSGNCTTRIKSTTDITCWQRGCLEHLAFISLNTSARPIRRFQQSIAILRPHSRQLKENRNIKLKTTSKRQSVFTHQYDVKRQPISKPTILFCIPHAKNVVEEFLLRRCEP